MSQASHSGPAHEAEVSRGDRFEFGDNWRRFLQVLDADRIVEAETSIQQMLGVESLAGRRFLDIGSGSGLFSLAAQRLGAAEVHSFDFDPASVACTRELKARYFPQAASWLIQQGSILDADFVSSLGQWDVVYSWGVLHHTGALWRALDLAQAAVADDGILFLSIYNDQGIKSRAWRAVKRMYNRLPAGLRLPFTILVMGPREALAFALALVRGRPMNYVRSWTLYKRSRGMSRWHDIVDWVGGYPFEVAKPEEVFDFLRLRGFGLERLFTCAGGIGCNQFVFCREPSGAVTRVQ
jgi:2-polyprenyl-6-hydroxyphenyl methylase/3-demethylubiquinone-9 3-methyltransferase